MQHSAMTKPGWACVNCGRSFTRRSSAKRHVDRVHLGFARYVTWSDYLAGRTTGIYPPAEPPGHGTPKHTPSLWERQMDMMNEGFWNETGRILARQALMPTSYNLPSHASSTPYVGTPYFGEHVFGIHSYICSNCLAIKPSTLCYAQGDKGGGFYYRFYCPPKAARSIDEFGSTKQDFLDSARKSCIYVLEASVRAWMGNSPELIAVEIEDPDRYAGRITFLRNEVGRTLSVTLDYADNKCLELDPSRAGGWILRAINSANHRTNLDTSELSEFTNMTQTASYAFSRFSGEKPRRTFLLALAKEGSNTSIQLKQEGVLIPAIEPSTDLANDKINLTSRENISSGKKLEQKR